jgi:hypothetical protein
MKLVVDLTDEEHAKLVKLAARVGRNVDPKRATTMTAAECIKHYIAKANVDDDWEHPSAATTVKR